VFVDLAERMPGLGSITRLSLVTMIGQLFSDIIGVMAFKFLLIFGIGLRLIVKPFVRCSQALATDFRRESFGPEAAGGAVGAAGCTALHNWFGSLPLG